MEASTALPLLECRGDPCAPSHQSIARILRPSDFLTDQDSGGSSAKVHNSKQPTLIRKMHKANREKDRRDRLNEHFIELIGALESDRPKNDKASILGDAIQMVRELSAEVQNLRTEQACLAHESEDLTQETNELLDEKTSLKSEVEKLQCQVEQLTPSSLTWVPLHHPSMMMANAFPYAASATENVSDSPHIPLPVPPGLFIHPALQGYLRPNGGRTAYLPHKTHFVPLHPPNIKRPLARYPTSRHPLLPGVPIHNQGQTVEFRPLATTFETPKASQSDDAFTESSQHLHTTMQLLTPHPTHSKALSSDTHNLSQAQDLLSATESRVIDREASHH